MRWILRYRSAKQDRNYEHWGDRQKRVEEQRRKEEEERLEREAVTAEKLASKEKKTMKMSRKRVSDESSYTGERTNYNFELTVKSFHKEETKERGCQAEEIGIQE